MLRAEDGTAFNARIDLDSRGIVVHSRSGTARNRDYRPALELLLARLGAASIVFDVFLDSAPVRHIPLEQRRLEFPRDAPVSEQFDSLVRAMNAGSASHGAWRRLLITTEITEAAELAAVLGSPSGRRDPSELYRLPAFELRKVTPEHVDAAVARLLSGEEAANFAPSRDFDLLAPTGVRFAPKKVFGLALEEALGIEAGPAHFSAGIGTPCFQILEAAGYPILRKGEAVPGNAVEPVDPDLAAAEGHPKLVTHLRRERRPALAAAKRRAMIDQLGQLQCERCYLIPSVELGPHGDAVIEVHHAKTSVANMGQGHVTRLADLVCLCANCHRIVHREMATAS